MPKKIDIRSLETCKVIRRHNSLQFWRQATSYKINDLLQRRDKLANTITKITNANIPNSVFRTLAEAAKELETRINYNDQLSYKENIIAKLQKEHDDIEYLLTFGSSLSSSSSSSSYSSSSSSSSSSA